MYLSHWCQSFALFCRCCACSSSIVIPSEHKKLPPAAAPTNNLLSITSSDATKLWYLPTSLSINQHVFANPVKTEPVTTMLTVPSVISWHKSSVLPYSHRMCHHSCSLATEHVLESGCFWESGSYILKMFGCRLTFIIRLSDNTMKWKRYCKNENVDRLAKGIVKPIGTKNNAHK